MLIPEIFFTLAAALLVIRFIFWSNESKRFVVLDAFSAMFMFIAFYYFVLAPVANAQVTTTSTNSVDLGQANSTNLGNVIANITLTANPSRVPPHSQGFIMLTTMASAYILVMSILGIRDFIASRDSGY